MYLSRVLITNDEKLVFGDVTLIVLACQSTSLPRRIQCLGRRSETTEATEGHAICRHGESGRAWGTRTRCPELNTELLLNTVPDTFCAFPLRGVQRDR